MTLTEYYRSIPGDQSQEDEKGASWEDLALIRCQGEPIQAWSSEARKTCLHNQGCGNDDLQGPEVAFQVERTACMTS